MEPTHDMAQEVFDRLHVGEVLELQQLQSDESCQHYELCWNDKTRAYELTHFVLDSTQDVWKVTIHQGLFSAVWPVLEDQVGWKRRKLTPMECAKKIIADRADSELCQEWYTLTAMTNSSSWQRPEWLDTTMSFTDWYCVVRAEYQRRHQKNKGIALLMESLKKQHESEWSDNNG